MKSIKIYFNEQDELASAFPREGARIATQYDLVGCYFVDENGNEYDSRDEPFLSVLEVGYVELADGIHKIDKDSNCLVFSLGVE